MKGRSVLAVLSLLLTFPVDAADESRKTPVFVSGSGKDYYAQQLSFHVKELIRGSQSMSLVLNEEDAAYRINLVAMDTACKGVVYAAAYVWAPPKQAPLYQTHTVGTCNQEGLQVCAQAIVVDMADNIEGDSKMWAEALKELKRDKQ